MDEIPTVEELAQIMRDASGGQPLSIEQLATIAREEVLRRKRAVATERMRAWRAQRRARENLAHAS